MDTASEKTAPIVGPIMAADVTGEAPRIWKARSTARMTAV